ncbi:MAG: diguanylate cyclase [Proteobacteria bacterium]|nr:diguanylate cyclase [Pseudomonadota bacterium]
MLPESPRKADDHRAVRNVTRLTVLFVVSLWVFFAYWAVTSRQETISATGNGLSQMAHAVEQYSTNLFKMAEIFQVTAERWLAANSPSDPRTDAGFIALVEDFRKRTNNLIDIRMASANGDLYYFPNDQIQARDNVADREYFKAVIDSAPGLRHIGIPVVSRVSGQWRLPVTVRMKQSHRGLEVINASVDLGALISAFESERPKPNGTIGLWKTDGTLLVRAPQADALVGKKMAENWLELELISTQPAGWLLSEASPIDGEARLVGHARLTGSPLVVVVTATLADTLNPYYRQLLRIFVALVLVTFGGAMFSARLVRALRAQERDAAELQRLARTDPLTGLFNRRHFFASGLQEFSRARRYGNTMSLLMLDIDYFKVVNDTWGHPTGDRVLQALAEIMGSIFREQDCVGRLGGEEFAVILPETELSGALISAERLRAAVAQSAIASATDDGKVLRITVSIGIAVSTADDVSFETVLARADKKLYAAKESGRNRVLAS